MAGQLATYPKHPGCQAIRHHSTCRQHPEGTRLVRKKGQIWPTRWVLHRAIDAIMILHQPSSQNPGVYTTYIVVHRSRNQERTQTNIGCKRSSLDLSNASARFFSYAKKIKQAHLVSRRRIAEPDERSTCNHARQHMNRLFRWRRRRSYRKSKCLPTSLIFR